MSPSGRETFRQRAFRRLVAQTANDLHGLLNSGVNRFFKAKSLLEVYRTAGWVPDRIPDEEVPLPSALASIRLSEVKQLIDPVTEQISLEDTELVKRARSMGMPDVEIIRLTSELSSKMQCNEESAFLDRKQANLSGGHSYQQLPKGTPRQRSLNKRDIGVDSYFEGLKFDLVNDIYGMRPFSSVNYVSVLARFMLLFMQIEKELKSRRNSSWVEVYEGRSSTTREKRVSLTTMALGGKDEECLQVMADAFQNPRAGFMNHIYWNDLEDYNTDNRVGIQDSYPLGPSESCTVS